MTHLLGLTGSIGMGKSTTAQIFRDNGIPVWDADAAVHALYDRGGQAVDPIADHIPGAVVNGVVDRDRLKSLIARDPQVLETLEQIVHPLVADHRAAFIAAHDHPLLVFDIPLLFETGAETWLTSVLVVTVSADVQKSRVMSRSGMTETHFKHLLSRQMPDAEKQKHADHVITTYTLDDTERDVKDLIGKLVRP